MPQKAWRPVEYPGTGYRDAEGGEGASAPTPAPASWNRKSRGSQSPTWVRLGIPAPSPLQFLPLSLSPCPSPGAGLPAFASPFRTGAASSPAPRGPAPEPRLRLRLRVTIVKPALRMTNFCALHIPAAPAARHVTRFSLRLSARERPGTTTPGKLARGARALCAAGSADRASGGGSGLGVGPGGLSFLRAGTALRPVPGEWLAAPRPLTPALPTLSPAAMGEGEAAASGREGAATRRGGGGGPRSLAVPAFGSAHRSLSLEPPVLLGFKTERVPWGPPASGVRDRPSPRRGVDGGERRGRRTPFPALTRCPLLAGTARLCLSSSQELWEARAHPRLGFPGGHPEVGSGAGAGSFP